MFAHQKVRGDIIPNIRGLNRVGTLYGEEAATMPVLMESNLCVYSIVTTCGLRIQLTEKDKLFTPEGWEKAVNINEGELVVIGASTPERFATDAGRGFHEETDPSIIDRVIALDEREPFFKTETGAVFAWAEIQASLPTGVGHHYDFLTRTGHCFVQGFLLQTAVGVEKRV